MWKDYVFARHLKAVLRQQAADVGRLAPGPRPSAPEGSGAAGPKSAHTQAAGIGGGASAITERARTGSSSLQPVKPARSFTRSVGHTDGRRRRTAENRPPPYVRRPGARTSLRESGCPWRLPQGSRIIALPRANGPGASDLPGRFPPAPGCRSARRVIDRRRRRLPETGRAPESITALPQSADSAGVAQRTMHFGGLIAVRFPFEPG